MHYPFVSVVVCTLNRKNLLKKCLNKLLNLNYPKSKYEIIVVDGGSVDGTISMLRKEFPNIKYIVEKRAGVSYARNKGLESARGDIVAFTDDDCIVTKNWLRNLVIGFSSNEVGAVGGPVCFLQQEKIPRKFLVKAALGGYDLGEKRRFAKFLITSNMAVKREVFQNIKFDVTLGRKGNMLFDNEDIEFCEKILRMGYRLLYNPKAIVYHIIDFKKRVNMRYILRRSIYSGISLYIMRKKYLESKKNFLKNAVRNTVGSFFLFLQKQTVENFYFFVRNLTSCFAFLTSPLINNKWVVSKKMKVLIQEMMFDR